MASSDELIAKISKFDQEDLVQLNKVVKAIEKKKKIKTEIEQKDRSKIDKTSEKYKLVLNFVNTILTNMGKPNIDDLTKFKNIDRDDILNEKNKEYYEEHEQEYLEHFGKDITGYYRKKLTKTHILTFFRGIVDDIGLELTYIQKNITSKRLTKTHLIYSIN